MDLPELTEILRWTILPGDCLVVRTDRAELSQQEAEDIRRGVRAATGAQVPVLVLPRDWTAEVVGDATFPVEML